VIPCGAGAPARVNPVPESPKSKVALVQRSALEKMKETTYLPEGRSTLAQRFSTGKGRKKRFESRRDARVLAHAFSPAVSTPSLLADAE
jgi:hypothetical protein